MRGTGMVLMLVLPLIAGFASAHEPNHFTVIMREDKHDPMEVNLIVNDEVMYFNADDNNSHHIGLDKNGDGDFSDDGEFSSGILNSTCDWQNESDCRVAWTLPVNSTDYIGNYVLSDFLSNGTEIEIYLNVSADTHIGPGPGIDECFGAGCEEDESSASSRSNLENGMILGSLVFFLIAIGIGSSMIMDRQIIERWDESQEEKL